MMTSAPSNGLPARFANCVSTTTRHGRMTLPAADDYLVQSLVETGDYCRAEQMIYERLVEPGMTVLDVGANVGAMTLALAARLGGDGRVLAFEPCPFIHGLLCENVRLNDADTVEPRREIVSSGSGMGRYIDPDPERVGAVNFGGLSVGAKEDSVTGRMVDTPVVSIDDLGLDRCDFIKIDVEGHENRVIAGAGRTLERFRPVLSLEIGDRRQGGAWFDTIEALGYDVMAFVIRIVSAPNMKGRDITGLTRDVCAQAICLPAGHAGAARLAGFPHERLADRSTFDRFCQLLRHEITPGDYQEENRHRDRVRS